MSVHSIYNCDLENVSYTNDLEYRAWIRKIFCMQMPNDAETADQFEGMDEVSKDELLYDENAVMKALDFVYAKTRNKKLFKELYDLGAATMLSTDRSIGLSVLFSYDYMSHFHKCVICFLKTPENFNETNESYLYLKKKLT